MMKVKTLAEILAEKRERERAAAVQAPSPTTKILPETRKQPGQPSIPLSEPPVQQPALPIPSTSLLSAQQQEQQGARTEQSAQRTLVAIVPPSLSSSNRRGPSSLLGDPTASSFRSGIIPRKSIGFLDQADAIALGLIPAPAPVVKRAPSMAATEESAMPVRMSEGAIAEGGRKKTLPEQSSSSLEVTSALPQQMTGDSFHAKRARTSTDATELTEHQPLPPVGHTRLPSISQPGIIESVPADIAPVAESRLTPIKLIPDPLNDLKSAIAAHDLPAAFNAYTSSSEPIPHHMLVHMLDAILATSRDQCRIASADIAQLFKDLFRNTSSADLPSLFLLKCRVSIHLADLDALYSTLEHMISLSIPMHEAFDLVIAKYRTETPEILRFAMVNAALPHYTLDSHSQFLLKTNKIAAKSTDEVVSILDPANAAHASVIWKVCRSIVLLCH